MKRLLVSLAALVIAAAVLAAQDDLMVGTSVRDITPTVENELLPIPGIGTRDRPLVGVINRQHTRIIAFKKGDVRCLMICTETGKGPMGDVFCKMISEHTGIPVEAIFYTTTHSHAVPEMMQGTFTAEEKPDDSNVLKWARMTLQEMLEGCDEALGNLRPAKAFVGVGESYIATNRNYPYVLENGTRKRTLGPYLKGAVDPTLTVLKFEDMQGKPIAFIINQACHAVTMIGNTCLDGQPGLDPDFPGQVSRLLEEKYPGAVAMWTSGAAGDLNPFVSNQVMYPDPETGEDVTVYTGEQRLRDQIAFIHYDDIKRVLRDGMKPLDVRTLAYSEDRTGIPTEEGAPESVLSLQLLRLGDVAFLGTPGEYYSSIGKFIREHSLLPYTMVVDNTWNWPDSDIMYIEDDEGIINPGFGTRHYFKLGVIAPYLSNLGNRLIRETETEKSRVIRDAVTTSGNIRQDYCVYLPKGYTEEREYKVIYVSHGSTEDENAWIDKGMMQTCMDNLEAKGLIHETIVVSMNNNAPFENCSTDESLSSAARNLLEVLAPDVEKKYHASRNPRERAVCGSSAGGSFTVNVLNIGPDKVKNFGIFSVGRKFTISNPDARDAHVRFYSGDEDFRTPNTRDYLYGQAKYLGIEDCTYKELTGAHDWSVWREAFADFVESLGW